MKLKSIYIKPTRKKCSISDFKVFEIYDQDLKRIDTGDMDVIDIWINNCKWGCISMEVLNGMTHIWSNYGLEVEILSNTFIINFKEKMI